MLGDGIIAFLVGLVVIVMNIAILAGTVAVIVLVLRALNVIP